MEGTTVKYIIKADADGRYDGFECTTYPEATKKRDEIETMLLEKYGVNETVKVSIEYTEPTGNKFYSGLRLGK